jgi:hypothetical protein
MPSAKGQAVLTVVTACGAIAVAGVLAMPLTLEIAKVRGARRGPVPPMSTAAS